VTGGNKGIGLEISRNLSNAGCTVLLGTRNAERGQQAPRQIERAGLGMVCAGNGLRSSPSIRGETVSSNW
jgi:NAD(P)-dependent dehydrogenase (short-subunit alcohol dehydrogenase family)